MGLKRSISLKPASDFNNAFLVSREYIHLLFTEYDLFLSGILKLTDRVYLIYFQP